MAERFRWGILGTGSIATQFAEGLSVVDDAVVAAVGSRTQASADAFGAKFGASRCHSSYQGLAADPDIDAVYVATPHNRHREDALLGLARGKAVLCEKPFAIHLAEAEAMVEAARSSGVFLMEALWTRFNPVIVELCQLLEQGAIGEPRLLQCDFGFRADFDPASRLFDPGLGGGSLLDVGVYCAFMAHLVFGGEPSEVVSLAHLGTTGVDEQAVFAFQYPGGQLASCASAVRTETAQSAIIHGTEGSIRVPQFWQARSLELNGEPRSLDLVGNMYNYEAMEVGRCVREGRTESEIWSLDDSLALMRTLDRIRAPWELRYPADGQG